MHPYYGTGYQQRKYTGGGGLHIVPYDTATPPVQYYTSIDRADIYVVPTYVQQCDQQWVALDLQSHNQGHDALLSEGLPASKQRRQYGPTLDSGHYVNHVMKTDSVYKAGGICQDWTAESRALMHVPLTTIIPSERGPPNQDVVVRHDCCFQPDSLTPSSTKSALSTPTSLASPLHIPMDSPISNHDPVRDCRTPLDSNEISLRIANVSSGRWSCRNCERVFRRKQRALFHFFNKHEGRRLHCNGVCGEVTCHKSFACQEGLDVHLNPVEVTCQYCGRNLLRKNIQRHRKEHCHPLSV